MKRGKIPEWLLRLQEKYSIPLVPEEEEPVIPAMVKRPPPPPPGPGLVESIEWAAGTGKPAEEPLTAPPEPEVEVPDWLSRLREAPHEEPLTAPTAPEEAPSVPDWLRTIQIDMEPSPPAAEEAPGEEIPEWLQRLQPRAVEEPPEAVAPPSLPEEEEMPEWLKELQPRTEVPAAEVSPPPVPAPQVQAEEGEQVEEIPAWLREMQVPAAEVEEMPPEEVPEWQRRVGVEEVLAEEPAEGPPPDWLQQISERLPEEEEAARMPELEAEAEIPEWLQAIAPTAPAEEKAEVTPTPPAPARIEYEEEALRAEPQAGALEEIAEGATAEVPDWIKELSAGAEAPVISIPAEELAPTTPAELPEWLHEVVAQAAEAQPPEEEKEPGQPWAVEKERIPEEEALPPELPREEELASAEISEWLRAARPAEAERAEELAPAEIPAWLQALRPREEAEVPEGEMPEKAEEVESQGILAGLSGLLPVAPVVAQPRGEVARVTPPTLPGEEAARIFEAIVTETPGPTTIVAHVAARKEPPGWRRNLIRWIIYALLGLSLLTTMAPVTSPFVKLLGPENPEEATAAADFYGTIQGLNSDAIALVSFDYDPAMEGEMSPLARVVIRHLLQRGARVVALSLTPYGAPVAQAVLEEMDRAGYLYGERTLNLGYIPGGAAVPRLLAYGFPVGEPADYHLTRPLSSFADFASASRRQSGPTEHGIGKIDLIVTLAAGPSAVRWWVEQTRPGTPFNAPVVAAVAAVAEPMVRPYRDSGQIVGLLVGVSGTAAYDVINGVPDRANVALGAQSAAHLLLLGLVVAGNAAEWTGLLVRRSNE
jgi:hypothetical protein